LFDRWSRCLSSAGDRVGQFDTEPARFPLPVQGVARRRTCVTLHRPASRRSPKGVGPESFSAPERVDRAGDLVQPGVQPGLGLAVNLSRSSRAKSTQVLMLHYVISKSARIVATKFVCPHTMLS